MTYRSLDINWSLVDEEYINESYLRLCTHRNKCVALTANNEVRTWNHTMSLWIETPQTLVDLFVVKESRNFHTNEKVRTLSTKYDVELKNTWNDVYSNIQIYTVIQNYIQTTDEVLTDEQQLLVKEVLRKFEKNGVLLSSSKRNRLKDLLKMIDTLSAKYNTNMNNDSKKLYFTESDLKGLPNHILKLKHKHGDLYEFENSYADCLPIIDNVISDKVRRDTYRALNNIPGNDLILEKITELRREISDIFDYHTYAHYVLNDTMAKNPETVMSFQYDLLKNTTSLYKKEQECLLNMKKELKLDGKLEVHDTRMLLTACKNKQFDFDMSDLSNWFPLDKVITGTLNIYGHLLHLKFVEKKVQTWSDDVLVYEAFDKKSNTLMGVIYLDLYPRPGKTKHPQCYNLSSRTVYDGVTYVQSVMMICSNAPNSNLTFQQMETFFHEMGHCMHAICDETNYALLSSLSLTQKNDFVECPSQMFEFWCLEKSVMDCLSCYTSDDGKYELNSTMPNDVIEKIRQSKKFGQGHFVNRQLMYGFIDMELHTTSRKIDTLQIYANTFYKITGLEIFENINFFNSWWHMTNENFDSRYYGYMWSRVYATDMFSKFKDDPLNADVGLELREKVLKHGASKDPEIMITDFLGRKPNTQAYIEYLQS